MRSGNLEDEATHLVQLNQSEVRSIVRSYVFPDPEKKSIRVVHVDSKAFPEEAVIPIQFSPDPDYRLYHPMFIAIVDTKGPEQLVPPEGWGPWSNARIIEPTRQRRVS